MVDEFEKKMYFSGYISTMADAVVKMNPTMLCSASQKDIEAADLKSVYQQSLKEWLTMLNTFIKKATVLGDKYPIEDVIGIRSGSPDAKRENP